MKFSTTIIVAFLISSSAAFSPNKAPTKIISAVKSSDGSDQATKKSLFDPFGLYPKDSPERKEGILQPLESLGLNPDKQTVKDPLGIYSNKNEVDDNPMSASLPFVKRPPMLDGTIPGDRGFDPFNFSSNENALQWYRNAEIKHARLAMLAAVGWPLAELFDKKIAYALQLKPLLVFQDRVPSILNGGLDRTPAVYWASALGVAFAIESFGLIKSRNAANAGLDYTPGDLGFDPLGIAGKSGEERMFKAEAELFNGRLAMLAITGFAVQEWWTQNSIINETPIFFKPVNIVLEQLQDTLSYLASNI